MAASGRTVDRPKQDFAYLLSFALRPTRSSSQIDYASTYLLQMMCAKGRGNTQLQE